MPLFKSGLGAKETVKVNTVSRTLKFFRGTGESNANQAFSIAHQTSGAIGGGACTPNTWVARPMTDLSDPYNLADTTVVNEFLVKAGEYECSASAMAFSTYSSAIRIWNLDGSSEVIRGEASFAGLWTIATLSIPTFRLSLNSDTRLALHQICLWSPGGTPDASIYAFGLPLSEGAYNTYPAGTGSIPQNKYAVISCTRLF